MSNPADVKKQGMFRTLREIKRGVRDHYAFPGGYEIVLVMGDGGLICCGCARKEWKMIYWAFINDVRDEWFPLGLQLLEGCAEDHDDPECVHCNKKFFEGVVE